eukprot:TRINITY_DN919_c0_g1_i1.p1 TRINITY_DN919_c0_g1~~TRINITY_DN919_c0_g1_i1.p1  ORF type:complete len:339 (-),score=89.81 TRINITY_DN919_c0_g1_i1:723-1739(-)
MEGLSQRELDIQMMLAAKVHMGTKNCDFQMERYIYKRGTDGIYIINLGKTWDKLQLAARVIVGIENPQDICVQSARPYGQRAVLKFAQYTGAVAIAGRHTPGTFTNQLQNTFSEPRLLVLTDPRVDHQPANEAAMGNIPTIAFCDSDSPMKYVDIGIPANNKAKHSIGCLYWLLARMVLQMRGTITPTAPWDVMVDLFFYREPEENKPAEDDEGAVTQVGPDYSSAMPDFGAPIIGGGVAGIPEAQWDAPATGASTEWEGAAVPPPAQAAAADWGVGALPEPTAAAGHGWDMAESAPPPQAAPPVAGGWDAAAPPMAPPMATGWDQSPAPGWEQAPQQ